MKPTPGRIVHYRLSASDCEAINDHRGGLRPGAVHFGNEPREGDYYPAVIVRVFGSQVRDGYPEAPETPVNLKVLLDGNDDFWATSRYEGEGPGTWTWPPRD